MGKLFDNYGPRYLLLGGTFLHVFGLMMASLSSEYYQFILSQGVCSPIGASMLFFPGKRVSNSYTPAKVLTETIPAMTSCISWFLKKRALAFGVIAGGASIGGVIFPVRSRNDLHAPAHMLTGTRSWSVISCHKLALAGR